MSSKQTPLYENSVTDNRPFTCGKCSKEMSTSGWLCPDCLAKKWKNFNRNGLTRHKGVDYACNCYGSGSDSQGRVIVRTERWAHDKNCPLFRKRVYGCNDSVCDCHGGSTVNKDGSVVIHPIEEHEVKCPVRINIAKSLVLIRRGSFDGVYAISPTE